MKTDLSSFNNGWFKPGSKFKIGLWFLCNALFLKSKYVPFSGIKVFVLRAFGAKIGKGVVVKPCVSVKYPWRLVVGSHVWIGENVWIDNLENVEIGDHVCISQGALILCGNHNYKKPSFDLIVKPIVIKDGVWIGAKAVVSQGVVCHEESVLTMSSVATKDLEPNFIYQGIPAVKLRKRYNDLF